jgi:hypothetical protein
MKRAGLSAGFLRWLAAVSAALFSAGLSGPARAEDVSVRARVLAPQSTTTLRVPAETLPVPSGVPAGGRHPLDAALQFAERAFRYAHDNVRDYTCLLVKRERIEGDLRDTQYMQARVRTALVQNGRVVQPLSVFLTFQGPAQIKGRKVLYVEGRYDNKMLVRNGGKRFNYITVKVDPNGEAALRESLVPITQIGFASITESLITLIKRDMERDPAARNTKVKFYRNAKINDRVCTRISVLHPQPDPTLEFAEANVFVDDQLHVPIRIEASLWPRAPGEAKPLLFEYTYTDLRLNVGLTDDDFRASLLEQRSR